MSAGEIDVLIAGGGPVGLALALELGVRGVKVSLIEKRDGSVTVPKMSMVSTRNMEFCRKWGIADQVRDAVWDPDRELDFVYAESLRGRELARNKIPSYNRSRAAAPTPEVSCHCPQLYFDPILKARAAAEPTVGFAYMTSLIDFKADDEGVDCLLSTQDGERKQRARWLVGCDGAASAVRDKLGIALEGHGVMARSVNIFFRSQDLVERHDKGWARIYRFIDQGGCWSELIPIDGEDLWRLAVFDEGKAVDEPDAMLKRMFGGMFDYEILDVSGWDRRDFVAASYGRGRVYIAGDAAHQCSPTGGLGMATGIEEAVNLGWKLAAMAQGWGGEALLETYETERRPIAQRNVSLSTRAFRAITSIPPLVADSGENARDWRGDLGVYSIPDFVKFQYSYAPSPICPTDGSPPPNQEPASFIPSAAPGSRAPHIWLEDGGSILDLFGLGFTLLRFAADADAEPLETAAQRVGLPLTTRTVTNEGAAQLYQRKLVLVRPDGHVAWRGDEASGAGAVIDAVRGATRS